MEKKAKREHLYQFHIAGFTYYEGAFVFDRLKIGTQLKLVVEPTNPFDKHAILIHLGEHKLGYVPRDLNYQMFKFMKLGYDLFTVVVQMVNPNARPEQQVLVSVFLEPPKSKS